MRRGRVWLLMLLSLALGPATRAGAAVITVTADASYLPVVCEGTGFVATGCSRSEIYEARVGDFAIRSAFGHFHRGLGGGLATFYPIDGHGISVSSMSSTSFRLVSVTLRTTDTFDPFGDVRPLFTVGVGPQPLYVGSPLSNGVNVFGAGAFGNTFNISLGDVRFMPRFSGLMGDVPYTLVDFTIETVPEPGALWLLAVAALPVLGRMRRPRQRD